LGKLKERWRKDPSGVYVLVPSHPITGQKERKKESPEDDARKRGRNITSLRECFSSRERCDVM